jgi:hypothetical protein
MSFDFVDGTNILSNNQLLPVMEVGQGDGAHNLVDLLSQMRAPQEDEPILQRADDQLDDLLPAFTINPDMPSDDGGGGGYFEINEPVINVPEGFAAADLYATELILDPMTGVLTMKLYFSTDPLDFQALRLSPMLDSLSSQFELGPDSLAQQQANGSKCVVTVTKTTTTTSGSSSFSILFGLWTWTSNSGGTSSTTTTTVTLEGVLVNSRCFINRG